MLTYQRFRFEVFPGVYEPREDSFLLADRLEVRPGGRFLDLGTGCGIQGILASQRAGEVIAVDINPAAVACARHNLRLNEAPNVRVLEGDLFEGVEGVFDTIAFNPPYLPTEPGEPEDLLSRAWDGGRDGRRVVDRFLRKVDGHLLEEGMILLVQSSLNGPARTMGALEAKGFSVEVVGEISLFFERLSLLRARRGGSREKGTPSGVRGLVLHRNP
jgi:release factor glutamine methyltransferase